jgi:hypothetical protein
MPPTMTTRPRTPYKPSAWAARPCERRVDGDRVTELWPAANWMARSDKNAFTTDEKTPWYPPALPKYSTRDHLHDRNRERTVFDPANPGKQQYVYVTRRRLPTVQQEEAAQKKNIQALNAHERRQEFEAAEANELLELRSMGIRSTMAAQDSYSMYGRAPPVPAANSRAEELEKRVLRTMEEVPAPTPTGGGGPQTRSMTMRDAKAATLRGGWPTK